MHDDSVDERRMSFLEHYEEARKRVIWSSLSVLICFFITYTFSTQIFDFLMQPIIMNLPEGSTLIFARPAEGFITYLKVGIFSAIFLALPFIMFQAWRFIAPAMYKHEKRIAIPFIFFGAILFFAGAAFCYFVVAPFAFNFLLLEYSNEFIRALPSISEALTFFMTILLGFGLIFEFPIVVFVMAKMGVVSSSFLRKNRKYAILISAVIATMLTPADIISMVFMFIPLLIFYELGILIAWIFGKKRKEENSSEDADM